MIKYVLLVAVWMLPLAAAHAQPALSWKDTVKESIDATQVPDMPRSPDGTPTPSDLNFDLSFFSTGMASLSPISNPPNATDIGQGVRVFQWYKCQPLCQHLGYYVVGRITNENGTFQSTITRRKADGTLDLSFGTVGWMYPSSTVLDVEDEAIGSDKMYILSTIDFGGVPIMRVTCTVLSTGANCFSGAGGIVGFGASPSGAVRSAYARRIVYDPRYGLFIAGRVKTVARGWELAAARLDANTGGLVAAFHGDGTTTGLPTYAAQTSSDVDVYDMTVVPAGIAGGERLYIAGTVKLTATDYDGFVLGLSPNDGYTQSGWAWKQFYFEADNMGYLQDAATAITVQRNGRLAIAGWSETDVANERSMILGRMNADGSRDYSFCDESGFCKRNFPWAGVVEDDLPAAIVERSGNRDLVIALKHRRPAASDPRPRQLVVQYGASGNVGHASRTIDFPANTGVTAWSTPTDMWIGNIAFSGEPENEVVVVVGTRKWNTTDYDATLTQLKANDSIFAAQFGNRFSGTERD